MTPDPLCYKLPLESLLWLYLMLHIVCPSAHTPPGYNISPPALTPQALQSPPVVAHQRQWLGQVVAALYIGHGVGANRPCLDTAHHHIRIPHFS